MACWNIVGKKNYHESVQSDNNTWHNTTGQLNKKKRGSGDNNTRWPCDKKAMRKETFWQWDKTTIWEEFKWKFWQKLTGVLVYLVYIMYLETPALYSNMDAQFFPVSLWRILCKFCWYSMIKFLWLPACSQADRFGQYTDMVDWSDWWAKMVYLQPH